MNDGSHRGFVNAKPEGNGANEQAYFVRHPALLVLAPYAAIHFGVIADRSDSPVSEEVDSLFHFIDRRRIDDHVAFVVMAQRRHQQRGVLHAIALSHQVTQIRAMKTGDVLIGIAQFELRQNVVPHVLCRARGKGRDGTVGKFSAQTFQLTILRTKLMSPL